MHIAFDKRFPMFIFHFKLDFFLFFNNNMNSWILSAPVNCVCAVCRVCLDCEFHISHTILATVNSVIRYDAPISTSEHKILCNLCITMEQRTKSKILWINLNFIFFNMYLHFLCLFRCFFFAFTWHHLPSHFRECVRKCHSKCWMSKCLTIEKKTKR